MRSISRATLAGSSGARKATRLPGRTIELLKQVDAALFGAITSKPAREAAGELAPRLRDEGLVYRSPIVRLRQLFDLYVCLRPCRAFAGNPLNTREGIDLVIFRENTEDLYAGVEFHPVPQTLSRLLEEISPSFAPFKGLAPDQWAISCKINSRKGSERIIRAAFEFARQHRRKRVTVVHKANVVRATDGLFLEAARSIAADYPDIPWDHANVDAMAMWLLKNPLDYDVLVAPNLFGDIVSDLCAQMVGGLGFACSGNIGDRLAVFEPTHGSAPKYVGQSKVNPIATILAAKMMLDYLSEDRQEPTAGGCRGTGHSGRPGADLRHGRRQYHPANGRGHRRQIVSSGSSFGRSREGNRGSTPVRKRAHPS